MSVQPIGSRSTACYDGAAGRHGDASRLPFSGAQSSGPSWNEPRLRRSDRQRTGPSHRRRGTARKHSNPADQHRPHPTDPGLRPAPATIIDRYAPRSHRGGRSTRLAVLANGADCPPAGRAVRAPAGRVQHRDGYHLEASAGQHIVPAVLRVASSAACEPEMSVVAGRLCSRELALQRQKRVALR